MLSVGFEISRSSAVMEFQILLSSGESFMPLLTQVPQPLAVTSPEVYIWCDTYQTANFFLLLLRMSFLKVKCMVRVFRTVTQCS